MTLWNNPPISSPLWITPGEKPVEYLYEVKSIPRRPTSLKSVLAWDTKAWPDAVPETPDKVLYLGALEWTWSPAHSRFDSYYLAYTKTAWIIYLHEFSDGAGETWDWYPYAASNKVGGTLRAVGFWMVFDLLKADSSFHEVGPFHVVSGEGLLSVGDFKEIKARIW